MMGEGAVHIRNSWRRTRWFWISVGVFFAVMYLSAYLEWFENPVPIDGPSEPVVHAGPR